MQINIILNLVLNQKKLLLSFLLDVAVARSMAGDIGVFKNQPQVVFRLWWFRVLAAFRASENN
jgi:hypothetical protein